MLLWVILSIVWCALAGVLLPPVGAQTNYWVFSVYLFAGPLVIGIVLALLHLIDPNIFSSLQKAAPIGAIFIAIFALFGYLITAERESRRLFLEKQLESCADIAETVGVLATEGDIKLWNSQKNKFWAYYWGRLGVFETSSLEQRMVEFGDLLYNPNTEFESHNPGKTIDLHEPALCIAHTCKTQARQWWSVLPGLIRPDVQNDQWCNS